MEYQSYLCFAASDIRNVFTGLSNCDVVLPIYVGDDQTDEDAFKV